MKRLLPCQIFLFTMVLVFCGCEQQPAIKPSGKSIKIGIIAPFSGSDFAKGEEGLKGVQTAIKIQPLLDNGDRIEIIIKDDQNDPVKAVKALQELTQTGQVSALVTFSRSGPVLAMARVANTYKTPIIAALATHPDVTKGNDYVSQICFDNIFQGQVAALFVRDDLLLDRVAIFKSPDSFYSSNLATEFERKFTALGGEVTDVIEITDQGTDILKGVQAKNPELLYLPVTVTDVITIIQEVKQMRWAPRLMASDGLLATVFTQHKEQLGLLDGLLATEFFHNASQGTRFADRAGAAHKGRATSYTAMGVEGMAILLDAMNRCDDPANRQCINRQVRSTVDFEGLQGKISIDSNGKADRPLLINAIKNSQLKYIVKVY